MTAGPARARRGQGGFSRGEVRFVLRMALLSALPLILCAFAFYLVLRDTSGPSDAVDPQIIAMQLHRDFLSLEDEISAAMSAAQGPQPPAPAADARRANMHELANRLQQGWQRLSSAEPIDVRYRVPIIGAVLSLDDGLQALDRGDLAGLDQWHAAMRSARQAFNSVATQARATFVARQAARAWTSHQLLNWAIAAMLVAVWIAALSVSFLWVFQRRTMTQYQAALNAQAKDQSVRRAAVQATLVAERSRTESVAARKQFVQAVGHELRTPLQSLNNCATILEMALPDDQSARDVSSVIRLAIEQMNVQIADLSRFAITQSTSYEYRPAAVVIGNLFKEIRESTVAQFPDPKAELRFLLSDPHDLVAFGDKFRILQVANNLINNAIKYTPAGFVEVRLSASRAPAAKGGDGTPRVLLQIDVQDTGIGIPPADLPFIFDPTFRASNSPESGAPGLGMGLPIAQVLAREMGGDLVITSTLGSGTHSVATLYLPLDASTGQSAA